MDFWAHDKISWNNVRFERIGAWEEYKKIRKRIESERIHLQTGWLIIDIPKEIKNVDKVKEYSLNLIDKLHLLISFAHGHDVPIHELLIYEVSDGRETLKAHEISSIWTGKPGASSLNVYPHGLDRFLNSAMPLISNEDFVSKTNVTLAILYYNLAVSVSLLEIKFTTLWLGLEAMANAFYESNPKDLILTRDEWNDLKTQCRDYLTRIGKRDVYSKLLQNLQFLRSGTIKERIRYMLKDAKYQMQQYFPEVEIMYDNVRVPLFHGRRVDWTANFDKVYKLKRLMEKIIFKTLDFYDNDMIYYAIKEDDLSKR